MNGWSPCHSHLCWLAEQQPVIPRGMGGTSAPQGRLGGCHRGLLSGDRVLVNSVLRLTSLVLLPDSLMRMPPRIPPLPKTCCQLSTAAWAAGEHLFPSLAYPSAPHPTARATQMWTQSWRTGSTGSSRGCPKTRGLPRRLPMMAA